MILKLRQFTDERGALTLWQTASAQQALPFSVERVFWITGVPLGQERAGHAHRTCAEALVAVAGSFSAELIDSQGRRTYHLSSPDEALLIPPMVWARLYDFSPGTVCLCLASEPYKPEGYINQPSR